jgi:perosamine synthetase
MTAILDIARRRRLHVIEDSCEALGSRYRGQSCGTLGDAGTFAFYPNKQMTTGEGGVVVTDDPALDAVMKSLRNQGRGASGAWLQHERMGFNYRLADINCALGLSQLSRIDTFLAARRRVAETYGRHLAPFDEIELPVEGVADREISWFVYVVRLKNATRTGRDAFMEHLRARGVACANYFSPIHLQPYFQQMGYKPGDFPVTEAVADTTVALPFFNRLSEDDVEYVASVIEQALHATRQAAPHSLHRSVLQ